MTRFREERGKVVIAPCCRMVGWCDNTIREDRGNSAHSCVVSPLQFCPSWEHRGMPSSVVVWFIVCCLCVAEYTGEGGRVKGEVRGMCEPCWI
jgi:hypothetical protein